MIYVVERKYKRFAIKLILIRLKEAKIFPVIKRLF